VREFVDKIINFSKEFSIIDEIRNEFYYQIDNFNLDNINELADIIKNIEGNIYFCGVGKSGNIAKHCCDLLKCISYKSFYFDILNSTHGDIGTIKNNDIILLFSNSGNTSELINIIPSLKKIGIKIIGICCNKHSKFEELCDITIVTPFNKEISGLTILNNKYLIKWYGMNINYDHHKLISLPIGLQDLYIHNTQVHKILELNQNYNCKKDILLYISYFGPNHEYCNRHKATKKLIQNGFKQNSHKSWNSYIEDIHRSKFVFCPWGNGIDTYRFWETYAVNSIPIILNEYFIPKHFSDIKMLVVDNLDVITKDYLEKKIY